MNRPYSAQSVIEACQRLNQAKKKPFLACDIITGFPGETDEDFDQTMKLCEACDFAWVHAFPYSERPGTAAAVMKNKVPQSVSGQRAKALTDWAVAQKIKYVEAFIASEHEAVLETVKRPMALAAGSKQGSFIYHAVTDNFIHCEIVSKEVLEANRMVKIKLTGLLSERIKKGGDIEASAEFV